MIPSTHGDRNGNGFPDDQDSLTSSGPDPSMLRQIYLTLQLPTLSDPNIVDYAYICFDGDPVEAHEEAILSKAIRIWKYDEASGQYQLLDDKSGDFNWYKATDLGFGSTTSPVTFWLEGCWEVYAAPLQVAMQLRDYNPPCDVTPTDLTHATVYDKTDPGNTWLRLGTTTTLSVSVSPPELVQGATFSWSVNSKLRIVTFSTTSGLWQELPLWQTWITTDSNCVVLAKELSDSIGDAQAYCAFSNTITSPTASGPPATQPIDFDGNPSTPNEFVFPVTVFDVDLDIDSDNNSAVDSVTSKPFGPSRSIEEDAIEDIADNPYAPGKFIRVNNGDNDSDGVPDYADGIIEYASWGEDNANLASSAFFTPMVLDVAPGAAAAGLMFRFRYSASDPGAITRTGDAQSGYTYTPAPGRLRIWTKDGDTSRSAAQVDAGGDFVGVNDTGYTSAQLGFTSATSAVTLYLEGISPHFSPARLHSAAPCGIKGL